MPEIISSRHTDRKPMATAIACFLLLNHSLSSDAFVANTRPLTGFTRLRNQRTLVSNGPQISASKLSGGDGTLCPLSKIYPQARKSTRLSMGLLDNISSFLGGRSDDFAKLASTDDLYGPGPAILFIDCPRGISDEELNDMISDCAPVACASVAKKWGRNTVPFQRIDSFGDRRKDMMDRTILETLEEVVLVTSTEENVESYSEITAEKDVNCPILYFSGISNAEMMETYRTVAQQIFEETGGGSKAACAKAVPPAMGKTVGQIVEEISGDHMDALVSSSKE